MLTSIIVALPEFAACEETAPHADKLHGGGDSCDVLVVNGAPRRQAARRRFTEAEAKGTICAAPHGICPHCQ